MRVASLCFAIGLLACGGEVEPTAAPQARQATPGAFCEEHGVLEALCTQCNPALVPVFRARGDYCEEHSLPESICPICHPEREGRPETSVSTDTAPADGTRVRLASPELARRIGIRVEEAVLASESREIAATARVAYDPARLARLNPRSPGVIRTIHADVGQELEAGDALVTIASAAVGADRTRLAATRTRLEVAEAELARRMALEGVVSTRQRLESRRARDDARAELATLRASLGVIGRTRGSEYTLTTPIAGVVIRRVGTLGAYVDSDTVLVEVADASRVWVDLEIPEDEVARVAPGQTVVMTMDALGEREFEGTLSYLAPEVDPRTRSVLGRVRLENTDGALRAHMYGRGRVQVPREAPAVQVPRGAVQRARGAALVFVRVADELYEARRVQVLERPGNQDSLEVRGRLAPGEQVVVDGAFLLRTETISDSIGAGCCAED